MGAQSIWVKLERYPPVLVRLLAVKDSHSLLSDEEIVARSRGALTLADVKQLSYEALWDDVPVAKMAAFVRACGVDFGDRQRMRALNRALRTKSWAARVRRDRNFPEYRTMLAQLLR